MRTVRLAAVSLGLVLLTLPFLPLFDIGLPAGMDTPLHVGNVVESARLLRDGVPPWTWLPDVAGGLGGPNYLYYGHLGFLLPAALTDLGLPPSTALKAAAGFFMAVAIAGSLACFSFLGKGIEAGTAASSLFVLGPYFLSILFVRGSYPEAFSLALVPILFLSAHRMLLGHRPSMYVFPLALSFVVGVHTLSLLSIVPFLAAFVLCLLVARGARPSLKPLICSGVLTLGMSSPFLVGPLFLRGLVSISDQFSGAGLYEASGVPFHFLFNKTAYPQEVVSWCFLGRVHLIALAAAAIGLLWTGSWRRNRPAVIMLVAAVVAITLVEASLAKFWVKAFPPLRFLQFPFRFLGMFHFLCAAALASVLPHLPRGLRLAAVCLLPVLCASFYFIHVPAQDHTVQPYATLDAIRASLTTLDHENKYMPLGAKLPERPVDDLVSAGDGCVPDRVRRIGPNGYSFRLSSAGGSRVSFHQYWFPWWELEVDSAAVPMGRDEALGTCAFDVSAGDHEVRITFEASPAHKAAACVSRILTALVLLMLSKHAISGLLPSRKTASPRGASTQRRGRAA